MSESELELIQGAVDGAHEANLKVTEFDLAIVDQRAQDKLIWRLASCPNKKHWLCRIPDGDLFVKKREEKKTTKRPPALIKQPKKIREGQGSESDDRSKMITEGKGR